jgi:hypothetical protein
MSLICFSSWAQYGMNTSSVSPELNDQNLIEAIKSVKPENIKDLTFMELSK